MTTTVAYADVAGLAAPTSDTPSGSRSRRTA